MGGGTREGCQTYESWSTPRHPVHPNQNIGDMRNGVRKDGKEEPRLLKKVKSNNTGTGLKKYRTAVVVQTEVQ